MSHIKTTDLLIYSAIEGCTKVKGITNRKLKLSVTENKEIGYSVWFAHALNLT